MSKKDTLYIFAGGKSSRFGGEPKILHTFEHNKDLLNKHFNVFIVTSKEIYKKIDHLDSDFIIQDMGNGSGNDVYNLINKINHEAFVCWSDVFYSEEGIEDIIKYSKNGRNCMTGTYRENPYISITTENGIMTQYKKSEKSGIQDNSLFFIKSLDVSDEEFMDMAIKNNFDLHITETKTEYFNTIKELEELKLSKNLL